MSKVKQQAKITGYDRYIDWKRFCIPLGLLILMLLLPTPRSMIRVGAEYAVGSQFLRQYLAQEVFKSGYDELGRWQSQMIMLMEASVGKASFKRESFLGRSLKWARQSGVDSSAQNLELARQKARTIPAQQFEALLKSAYQLLKGGIPMDQLSPDQLARVEQAAFKVKAAVGTVLFVVGCFMTEAIPLAHGGLLRGHHRNAGGSF